MAGAMLGNSGLARQMQVAALGSPLIESEIVDDPIAEDPIAPEDAETSKERHFFDPTKLDLAPAFKLSRFADLKGKGCRVPPALVESVLGGLSNENTRPSGEGQVGKVGVGMDCTIAPIRLGGLSMISTTDMFYPVLDDPYMMGRIACSSILSDLYAMGVQEIDNMLMYLSVSTKMTEKERDKVIPLIIDGFKDTAKEAGTKVSGGQTVINPWLMVGGVATSICQQEEYIIPDSAVVGDVLVLTKPLGTGVALNCYHWLGSERWNRIKLVIGEEEAKKAYRRAVDTMARTNKSSALLMHKYNAHGATDITGLGLLGHAMALAKNQKNEVSFVIHNLPVIAKMAAVAKACGNMFSLLQGQASETSGGLLICLPREQAAAYCKDIERMEGYQSWIIGIVEKGSRTARIIDKPRVIEVPNKEKEDGLW